MALVVNTNMASVNAQRQLVRSQAPLQVAMQRLSSTLRINTAKDDAAGLAIATRLTSQIRGLTQAVRNANDGISVAQTAEGAMDEVVTALQRVRELSVQSAHGVYTGAERAGMNAEAQQLLSEINRISAQTRFSTVNLLDGSFGTKGMHVGALAGEVINITLASVHTRDILAAYTTTGGEAGAGAFDAANTITLTTVGGTFTVGASTAGALPGQTADSAWAKARAINDISPATGVTATAVDTVRLGTADVLAIPAGPATTITFQINNRSVSYTLGGGTGAEAHMATLRDAINAAGAGVTAAVSGNRIVMTGAGGVDIVISDLSTVAGGEAELTGLANDTTRSSINLASAAPYNIGTIGAGDTRAGFAVGAATREVGVVDLTSVAGANLSITSVDGAINRVTAGRGEIGAVLNRLEATVRNLDNVVENITASRSRIMDADFAAETANMTRGMIMQQAGISVLSQANTLPQNVLALLGGR